MQNSPTCVHMTSFKRVNDDNWPRRSGLKGRVREFKEKRCISLPWITVMKWALVPQPKSLKRGLRWDPPSPAPLSEVESSQCSTSQQPLWSMMKTQLIFVEVKCVRPPLWNYVEEGESSPVAIFSPEPCFFCCPAPESHPRIPADQTCCGRQQSLVPAQTGSVQLYWPRWLTFQENQENHLRVDAPPSPSELISDDSGPSSSSGF